MSVNDASRITIDDPRVMLQIVVSLTDDSTGVIYYHNMLIVQATWEHYALDRGLQNWHWISIILEVLYTLSYHLYNEECHTAKEKQTCNCFETNLSTFFSSIKM